MWEERVPIDQKLGLRLAAFSGCAEEASVMDAKAVMDMRIGDNAIHPQARIRARIASDMKSYRCYYLDDANVAHDSCDVMASCDGIAICLAIIALSKQRPGIKFVEVWHGTR